MGQGGVDHGGSRHFYAVDTDGDGRAESVKVLYSGFREGNPQHRVNGLVRGLDNWIYLANGQSGGTIRSTKTRKRLSLGGRDLRIRPSTGEMETEAGNTQFLRSRDDWGDWFGNDNTNPLWQYVLEERYLRRNPLVFVAQTRHDVSIDPGASHVYPVSWTAPRFNSFNSVNHFTSACSAIVYGDELFGPEFVGNSFVSEPVHNLVHREVMHREGILFTSHRADDEKQSEFLASRDNWCRPTMLKVGPDGALYVAAMYRQVIEHPEYIPRDLQKGLDFRAGSELGRIFRVFPVGKKLEPVPKLAGAKTATLVAALDSPHGWQRDTRSRIWSSGTTRPPSAASKAGSRGETSARPVAGVLESRGARRDSTSVGEDGPCRSELGRPQERPEACRTVPCQRWRAAGGCPPLRRGSRRGRRFADRLHAG